MSLNQVDTPGLAYGPNSLEYINRPNPVEPYAGSEKHPLNNGPGLDTRSKEDFLRLLLNKDVVRSAKRKKSMEPKPTLALDLPKLPNVRKGTQRPRIPPTLSGLHHPPPDAGLLPSMSVEKPPELADKPNVEQDASASEPKSSEACSGNSVKAAEKAATRSKQSPLKRKHNKWSDNETTFLLKGVAEFGIGQWTKILKCSDYQFQERSALDLKDRFRVCCPDQYRPRKKFEGDSLSSIDSRPFTDEPSDIRKVEKEVRAKKKNESMTPAQLQELGFGKAFEKSKRRRRTGYSNDEDEALLQGFKKHGNAWAKIRNKYETLQDRTATDLRDRFRTRYPDEYAKAGLAPRLEKVSKRPRSRSDQHDTAEVTSNNDAVEAAMNTIPRAEKLSEDENKAAEPPPPQILKKSQPVSIFETDDVFWGAPFDPHDGDAAQITLDRGILDWAFDITRPAPTNESASKGTTIDPLATLNLPRPTATVASANTGLWNSSVVHSSSSANALPSLATITDNAWNGGSENEQQLELPSLMGDFAGLEGDGRAGGHFMSMEELLS